MCIFNDSAYANVLSRTERRHVINELYKALKGRWKSQTHYLIELPKHKVIGIGRVDGINGGVDRSTFIAVACLPFEELLINRTICFYLEGLQYNTFLNNLKQDSELISKWRALLQSRIESVYVCQDGLLKRNNKVSAELVKKLDELLTDYVHVKLLNRGVNAYDVISTAVNNPDVLKGYFVDAVSGSSV